MSKQRYDWWGYVRKITERYPNCQREKERAAVEAAIKTTSPEILRLIERMYWQKNRKTIDGAAMNQYISLATAKRQHSAFIKEVAHNLELLNRENERF